MTLKIRSGDVHWYCDCASPNYGCKPKTRLCHPLRLTRTCYNCGRIRPLVVDNPENWEYINEKNALTLFGTNTIGGVIRGIRSKNDYYVYSLYVGPRIVRSLRELAAGAIDRELEKGIRDFYKDKYPIHSLQSTQRMFD